MHGGIVERARLLELRALHVFHPILGAKRRNGQHGALDVIICESDSAP